MVRFVFDPAPFTSKYLKQAFSAFWDKVSSHWESQSGMWLLPRPLVHMGLEVRSVFSPPFLCLQVDSAMSLIQAAKNLMNAVVQTVKASYVASTKYQKSQGMASLNLPAVSWKMKAPEKKPLVKREKQDETQTKIKRASQKKHVNPVQALSEFKAMDSI